jgi:hypothetical protein
MGIERSRAENVAKLSERRMNQRHTDSSKTQLFVMTRIPAQIYMFRAGLPRPPLNTLLAPQNELPNPAIETLPPLYFFLIDILYLFLFDGTRV